MKLKIKVLLLFIALICAILHHFFLRFIIESTEFFTNALIAVTMLAFVLFLAAFISLAEIINKINVKTNLCLFIIAISGIVCVSSLIIGISCVEINKNVLFIIFIFSFISILLFYYLASYYDKKQSKK